MLYKMQKIVTQGNMYNWIKDYLHNHTISTKVNDSISRQRSLEEALSRTLFLIYINNLPKNLEELTALFADDLVLWTKGKHFLYMQRQLNRALSTLSTYCEIRKLQVNTKKTVYSIFTLSQLFGSPIGPKVESESSL